jgi:hypothetical protein
MARAQTVLADCLLMMLMFNLFGPRAKRLCPTRGHIATSPLGGVYATPSLCGSA